MFWCSLSAVHHSFFVPISCWLASTDASSLPHFTSTCQGSLCTCSVLKTLGSPTFRLKNNNKHIALPVEPHAANTPFYYTHSLSVRLCPAPLSYNLHSLLSLLSSHHTIKVYSQPPPPPPRPDGTPWQHPRPYPPDTSQPSASHMSPMIVNATSLWDLTPMSSSRPWRCHGTIVVHMSVLKIASPLSFWVVNLRPMLLWHSNDCAVLLMTAMVSPVLSIAEYCHHHHHRCSPRRPLLGGSR